MNKVTIDRELLERLAGNGPTSTLSATRELRAILAAPRQPPVQDHEGPDYEDGQGVKVGTSAVNAAEEEEKKK